MKKAKIFLTVLTVLAIVGGALAFKTRTLFQYYVCDVPSQKCIIPFTTTFETTEGGFVFVLYDILNAPCKEGNICETLVKIAL